MPATREDILAMARAVGLDHLQADYLEEIVESYKDIESMLAEARHARIFIDPAHVFDPRKFDLRAPDE